MSTVPNKLRDWRRVLALAGVLVFCFGIALVRGRVSVGPLPLDAIIVLVPVAVLSMLPLLRREGLGGAGASNAVLPLMVFLAIVLVSLAANGFGFDTISTFVRYASYALLVITVAAASRDAWMRHAFAWLLYASGVAVSGIGLEWYGRRLAEYRAAGGPSILSIPAIRIFSTFQNANFLGEFLVVVFCVGLALALSSRKWVRYVAWAGLVPVALTLVLTYTRGSWLALAAAVALALLLVETRYFFALAVAGAVGLSAIPGFSSRLASSFEGGGTGAFRLKLWHIAGGAIADKPLFGWGPGRFYDAFAGTVARHPELGVGYAQYGAHNSFFTLAAETGVAGGVAFLVAVLSLIATGMRAVSVATDRRLRTEAALLTAGLGSFAMNSLTSNSFQHPQPAAYFWLLAGLVGGAALQAQAEAGQPVAVLSRPWLDSSVAVRAWARVRAAFSPVWQASLMHRLLLVPAEGRPDLVAESWLGRVLFGRSKPKERAGS